MLQKGLHGGKLGAMCDSPVHHAASPHRPNTGTLVWGADTHLTVRRPPLSPPRAPGSALSTHQRQGVLNTEWGGMNEAFYNLYAITNNHIHLAAGLRFNHHQWTVPLAVGIDNLDGSNGNYAGNHANTHLPQIVGSARGYELTGNVTQHAIVSNFFHILTAGANESWNPVAPGGHSFATGGSNAAEHWFQAAKLADSLQPNRWGNYRNIGARTEESCTQYNVLKVARHLFQWSADCKIADFYERAFLNGILVSDV